MRIPLILSILAAVSGGLSAAEPVSISGIYPSLAMFNNEGECGTGAVVPWADRLWAITYAPHQPTGSSDKLYEITPDLQQIVRPESVGGTPANRMIHRESNQLFIGPYAIDHKANVRTLTPKMMFGRHTGNARHLFDPAGKIYYATMEEGVYEVDVKTLAVTELWTDEAKKEGHKAELPGYHGKGLYSGQGRLIYANNGDRAPQAKTRPDVPSGALAEWDGKADKWTLLRRTQFTEVTGPGGIYGNENPGKDPVWTIGWDHRSLILMCLDGGKWLSYRLPKSSHSYDGAHGWNTEWPRIREIGEDSLLMTMHGAFWKFPKTFSAANTAGITPRSNYLKVIGDFTKWKDRIVLGCDDTAKNEFLNKRKAKGTILGPQSQSNLWFVSPETLDNLGPVIGRGALWMNEKVEANVTTEAYLIAGYDKKGMHLVTPPATADKKPATITIEVDEDGKGTWKLAREIRVTSAYQWEDLSDVKGIWIRLKSDTEFANATSYFQFRNEDKRSTEADAIFAGAAHSADETVTGGVVRAREGNKRTLAFLATAPGGKDIGCYELDAEMKLKATTDETLQEQTKKETAIPVGAIKRDKASVIYVDDKGKSWRLPKGGEGFAKAGPLGDARVSREVATERDLFNAEGTFYELPAENAGGFAKVRPVSTSDVRLHDYCSYRGLFIMSGVKDGAGKGNPHVVRSEDGKAALWVGAVDDIWKLGKPRGQGGPWKDSAAKAGVASDPYLMTAYDKKKVTLSHTGKDAVKFKIEVDITGTGDWLAYNEITVAADKPEEHAFPDAFSAYWVRVTADKDTTATATFIYE